jgi:hypothetical protein
LFGDSAGATIEVFVKKLPKSENSLVLRTDFSDDSAWESICAAIREGKEKEKGTS